MIYYGRQFPQSVIDRIQKTVIAEPSISRLELSRRVCQWLDWRSANGKPQEMSCRKALNRLERQSIVTLPRQNRTFGFEKPASRKIVPEIVQVECSLQELGQISVYPVSSRYCKDSKIWFALVDQYHYLGSGPLCGAQIRYLVKSSIYGYLGALAFTSAAWALRDRDKHIGWTQSARRHNLDKVVDNARFLILPTVKVANLASFVLTKTLDRLTSDWEKRYHTKPVLVETFTDPTRFAGTCYRAANWQHIGKTAGRRDGIKKDIWLFPLSKQWQETLCHEPEIRLGSRPRPEAPADWAEAEFGTVAFFDNRLKQRLYKIADDFYHAPEANIPEASVSKAGTMGAYRFFQNPKVTMDVLLDAHREATIDRIRQHAVVLAPQDTTTLKYTGHQMTEGLGPVCHKSDQSIGLILHDTLAFTEDGTPLGVLDAQCWARDEKDQSKSDRRHSLPIEQKESMKWLRSFERVAQAQQVCPDTRLISIGDRESDIYELFDKATQTPNAPGLLIRSDKSRKRRVEQAFLWEFMPQQEVAGTLKIHIPRSGRRKARDAWVDVRFAQVELQRPKTNKVSARSILVWAVYVVERDFDELVSSPIEWMLLTTEAVESFDDAKKRIEWYSGRWGIEVYHRTLKSGCRISDRQFGSADRIEACLGIDMVVAWRIYHLTMLGREVPDVACTAFFKDIEWKALCCYVNKTPIPPEKPPRLKEAVYMLGSIGGHLGRKGDGPPGVQTLWRGLRRLDVAVEMYEIFKYQEVHHPMQSGP